MKYLLRLLVIVLGCGGMNVSMAEETQEAVMMHEQSDEAPAESALSEQEQQYMQQALQIWNSLDRQQGEIKLGNNVATLTVPDNFYYLNPKDSETVLVDVWGNLPGAGSSTLGMLFPAEFTPFDSNAWAVTIEYEQDGYVSDEDADDIDYDDLLSTMKSDTRDASKQRVQQGYEAIELVGWAEQPRYDPVSHKLYWAKEIKFGDQPVNTLNYNIRVLGRKGVLVLNFIADMTQKPLIDEKLESVVAMADFNQGSRYQDFDPDVDTVAAYGIGALVAGKVLAKTGFLALALVFLKKFGIFIVIGLGALVKRLFGRRSA